MDSLQALDSKFSECVDLQVGDCTGVLIVDIMAALNVQDPQTAVSTFTEWAETRNLKAVQLTVNSLMVGRHLA